MGFKMIVWIKWLLTVISRRSLAKIEEGRTVQVMVETTKIRCYMSNDLSTSIYKGIV